MRYVVVAVMLALTAVIALLPSLDPVETAAAPASEVPPVAICPIVETGDSHTSISVLSAANGEGRLLTFAAGEEVGDVDFNTGATGGATILAAEADAVGEAGGLIEMPSETTAAGVVTSGSESRSAESCADIPTGRSFLAGGSTVSGSFFEIQLVNPYAGEAMVDLTVSTGGGLESDNRFDGVIVPALSSITLDLTQIIPGRESIAVDIETTRGSVLAFGRQTTEGRTALWRAVAPADDWWLPVPTGGATKQMRIATPENAEIEYQVDLYGSGGVVEGYEEGYDSGTIEPRGSVTIPLARIGEEAFGVRVTTTGPVVPLLWMDSGEGLARTTGSPVNAPVWLLPGASAPANGSGEVTILNSGIDAVNVTVTSLSGESAARDFEITPEGVLVVDLTRADGYRVEASGPVVSLWTSSLGGDRAAAIGIPIQDE